MLPKKLPYLITNILLLLLSTLTVAKHNLKCTDITSTPNCTCGMVARNFEVQCGNSMDLRYKQNERFELSCPTQLAASFADYAETTIRPPRQALSYLQEVNVHPSKTLKMQSCDITNYPDTIEDLIKDTKATYLTFTYLTLPNGVLRLRHLLDNSTQDVLSNVASFTLRNSNLQRIPYEIFENMPLLEDLSLRENELQNVSGPFSPSLKHLELAGNAISEISPSAFRGLTSLAILQLFINNLTILDENIFKDLRNLKSLELMSNHLTSIHGELLANLEKLTWINLARNDLKTLPENAFWGNPLLNSTRLAKNSFTTLPEMLFQKNPKLEMILLDYNQIETLPEDIFKGLTSLEVLNLAGNQLSEISQGLFASLSRLRNLDLSQNQIETIGEEAFGALVRLEVLDLSGNKLTTLSLSSFQNLGNLDILNLAQNQIYVFDDDITFVNHMINLRTLDLSENRIDVIPNDFVLRNKLELIDLTKNRFTSFDFQVLENAVSNLTLQLQDNNITVIKGMKDVENRARQDPVSKLYKTLKLAGNPLRCDAFNNDLFRYFNLDVDTNFRYNYNIPGEGLICGWPPNIQGQPFDDPPTVVNPCKLTYNISTCPENCECTHIPFNSSVTIDCSGKGLKTAPEMFLPWDEYFNQTRYYCDMTATSRLKVILRDNSIKELQPSSFTKINVTLLDISFNNLSTLTWLPRGLSVLRLDHNGLQRINHTILDELREVTLNNNPWICDCETVPFWIYLGDHVIPNKMDVRCFDTHKSIRKLTRDNLCPSYTKLWIAVAVVCFLVLVPTALLAIYYKYRQEIKVWLFAHNMCLWFVREEDLDKDKIYDAFISFSQKDEDFILDHLLPKLEQIPDPYKICVHMRNWIPGEFIAKQVADSVLNSRRTIVVLSPSFLESVWGKMEFRTAHTKTMSEGISRVIIILYDDLDPNDERIDEELKTYLKTNTYIRWGDPWFWDKLKYALPHRKQRTLNGGYINKRFDSVSVNLDKMDKINQNVSIAVNTNGSANPPVDPLLLKIHPLDINSRVLTNNTPPAEKGVV